MARDKDCGVVDENFKVFGINNLYVCDASIFPDFVSTHQYLPTLAASKIFSLKQGLLSY
jgi:choline dehydrogenase-like flavoprotein